MANAARNELSDVLVALLKGVVYSDISAELWRDMLNLQGVSATTCACLALTLSSTKLKAMHTFASPRPRARTRPIPPDVSSPAAR